MPATSGVVQQAAPGFELIERENWVAPSLSCATGTTLFDLQDKLNSIEIIMFVL